MPKKCGKHKRRTLTPNVPFNCLAAIPGFPGYFASPDGRVFSVGWLTSRKHQDGYMRVNMLRGDGSRRKRVGVHQALALAFIGLPPKPGMEVRHKDGNKLNNAIFNLCWGTRKQNARDMVRHGRSMRGEKNAMSKLSIEQVKDIKRRLRRGDRQCAIQRSYPFVTAAAIKHIQDGTNWKHVA